MDLLAAEDRNARGSAVLHEADRSALILFDARTTHQLGLKSGNHIRVSEDRLASARVTARLEPGSSAFVLVARLRSIVVGEVVRDRTL